MLLAAVLPACAAPRPADTLLGSERGAPIVIGESFRLPSAALGESRTYNVWLPPSYAAGERRYPVLWLIDGGVEQDFHHITGLAQLAASLAMFRDLVVVGVETRDRRAELTYPSGDPAEARDFPTHGHSAAFRAFLTEELMPAVRARYRTSGEDALIGESLAGLFVLETFLKAPASADTFIAISPSLWWDGARLGRECAADLARGSYDGRALYLALAAEGGTMREGVLAVVDALRAAPPPGLRWTFSDRPDLEHATIYHREALEALVWAFAAESELPADQPSSNSER